MPKMALPPLQPTLGKILPAESRDISREKSDGPKQH